MASAEIISPRDADFDVPDGFEMLDGTLVEKAVKAGKISISESRQLLRFYESGLEGYTYLEEP